MTYAIVGTGGVGGFYGGLLAKQGCDVHFLFHSEYQAALQHGLVVQSTLGNFTIQPIQAYNDTTQMPPCDVVIVALKTVSEHSLATMLKPILKSGSTVVLVQNGLNMERRLAAVLPEDIHIAGGMAYICTSRVAPAVIHHQDLGDITFGMQRGSDLAVKTLCADLQRAGINAQMYPDLYEFRWKKLLWNIPYNGMTVILNATTEQLMANPSSRALIYDIMLEVIKGAEACGAHIPQSYADNLMNMTDKMKPYKPSMRLDYDNRRPMEIEYMYLEPLRDALAHGVDLPKIKVMAQQLQFIQDGYLTQSCKSSI